MYRLWSILFFAVPVLGTLSIVWAILEYPPMEGHWLPENINAQGVAIDHLFYLILILTGAIFIGTGLVLGWFMWKYSDRPENENVKYVHGSHRAELIWSILPAIVLLFLSFYQLKPWVDVTMDRPTVMIDGVEQPKPPLMKVTGRQFNWDFRYPGPDGLLETEDDLVIVDSICAVPADEDVVIQIEAEEVLHSFFIANMRVKQDVVPGMKQFVWFHATQTAECEIACTELCGWGHYKMKAKMLVLSRADYDKWLADRYADMNQTEYPQPSP